MEFCTTVSFQLTSVLITMSAARCESGQRMYPSFSFTKIPAMKKNKNNTA